MLKKPQPDIDFIFKVGREYEDLDMFIKDFEKDRQNSDPKERGQF